MIPDIKEIQYKTGYIDEEHEKFLDRSVERMRKAVLREILPTRDWCKHDTKFINQCGKVIEFEDLPKHQQEEWIWMFDIPQCGEKCRSVK